MENINLYGYVGIFIGAFIGSLVGTILYEKFRK